MRNKVKYHIAGRMTAILLTLVMIAGSFSIAVFADEVVPEENAPSAAAETTEKAEPEVKADKAEPSVETVQKESAPETTEPAKENAGSEATGNDQPAVNDEAAASQDAQVQNADEMAAEEVSAEEAVLGTEAVTDTAKLAGEYTPMGSVVTLSSYAISVMNGGQFVHSGDHVVAGTELKLSVKDGSGDHRFTINGSPIDGSSFTMPDKDVTIGVDFLFDISANDVPDDTTVTFSIKSGDVTTTQEFKKGGEPFYVAAGAVIIVQSVEGLVSGYQQGNAPGSPKQLKLSIGDSGNAVRISLNNSNAMKNAAYTMPEKAVKAVIATANLIKVTSDTDTYHKGTCAVRNLSDSTSEYADLYALPGDKINVTYDTNIYESVDITVADASGNAVSVSGGQFAMPSSMADLKVTYYYKARNVKVTNTKPDRGTISTSKSAYTPGDKVVVKIKSNSGYKFNAKTLVYTYTKDGKTNVVQITKGSDGKFSFIMPFYDVEIRGVFVEKATADKAADQSAYIDYSAAEDEAEEDAVDKDDLNLVPLTSAITAQTVLAVSTGLGIVMAD